MQAKQLEDVIARIENVEDDVLRLIEDHPQLIRSSSTLHILRRLKVALATLRSVRGKLTGLNLATAAEAQESSHYRILRKPH